MKNFKKVIAFLMVAAMTLGMGVVAFAEEAPAKVKALVVDKIEEAKSGDTVTIRVLTNQELSWNAGKLVVTLDETAVKTADADVKGANSGSVGKWWKLAQTATGKYDEAAKTVAWSSAAIDPDDPAAYKVPAGTVVAEFNVVLAKDVVAGDKIATVTCAFITDSSSGVDTDIHPEDVDVVISEKASESSSEVTDPTQPTQPGPTDPTQPGPAPVDPTTGATGATNAPAATTKDIVTKDDALNALDTLAKATAAAAKLNKAAFASDADYQAFTKALADANKVLSNPKATDAEKAAALKTLKDAMAKADEKALVAAVKAVINTTPATTKAGNGKTKTGDTAPVAALMLVAIAAFGTAVVVYRKKVNA